MKHTFIAFLSMTVIMVGTGCKENGRYVDPNTGRTLSLVKDANTGLMVNEDTKKPVYMYVDTETNDTIYGATGKVINGQIVYQNGKYNYENGEYKIKNGDYKKEVEKDGDITIKDGDKKIKIEGETGEVKVKKD